MKTVTCKQGNKQDSLGLLLASLPLPFPWIHPFPRALSLSLSLSPPLFGRLAAGASRKIRERPLPEQNDVFRV